MATDSANFSNNSAYELILTVNVSGMTISYSLVARKKSGSGFWTNDSHDYGLSIAGTNLNGTWTYDFRGATPKSITLRSGTLTKSPGSYNAQAWAEADGTLGRAPSSGNLRIDFSTSTVPGAPSNGSTDNETVSSIRYSFTKGAANGATITQSQVQYSKSSSFASGVTTVSIGTASTYTATGLDANTRYYFRARSYNSQGWGGWGGTVSGVTLTDKPGIPLGLASFGVDTDSAGVGWDAPGYTGGSAITGYDIQYSTSSTFASGVTTVTSTTTSRTLTGLAGATRYYVRVRAKNSAQTGDWSATLALTTIPRAPGTPSASSVTTSGFTASWTKPTGGNEITKYQMQYSTASSFSGATTVETTSLSQAVSGLPSSTTYYVRVRAVNGTGSGAWSSTLTVKTGAVPPNAPTGGSISNIQPQQMTFSFTKGSDNGDPITANQVEYSTSSSFSGATTVNLGASTTTTTPTGLTPNTTYYFRARSQNDGGWSPWSATVSAATLPATPPGITVTAAANGRSASVALTPPSGVSGVTNYTVQYRLGSSGTITTVTGNTPIAITGLTPGSTYQYRAAANFGSTYTSPYSSWVSLKQPNPNTNPGDYFDGSTAAEADVTYSWTGATNNSTSIATAQSVLAWRLSSISPSGSAVLARVTGGYAGDYAARMLFLGDQSSTQAQLIAGGTTDAQRAEVQAGATYTASMHVRPSRPQRLRVRALLYTPGASTSSTTIDGNAVIVTDTEGWTRLSVTFEVPSGLTHAAVMVEDVSGTGYSTWLSGEYLDGDAAMVSLGSGYAYFDGSTPDNANFIYDWTGTPHASTSTRTDAPPGSYNPLDDPDCDPIPQAPRPPVIPADCIVEVGLWRRYTIAIPASEVRQWSYTVPTIVLKTGAHDERQVRIRFYSNPDDLPVENLNLSEWDAEIILTYIPAKTQMTIDSITRRVWANVNGGESRPAMHLLYGTGGAPATWPELSCGIGHVVTLDVPTTAPAGNLSTEVYLTQRM